KIAPEDAGIRLDVFLQSHCQDLSRTHLKKLIEERHVWLNQKETKGSRILKPGDEVRVEIPPPQPLDLTPEAKPLDVVFEDKDLLVVNKPASWVVHPGAGVKGGTLVNALLHHCRDLSGIGGKLRPGIVHRLDKGTSGLIVVAKNDRSHAVLSEMFKSREVKKKYLAFVWGKPEEKEGVIDLPLGRSMKDRKKISSRSAKVRHAKTLYRLRKTWGPISMLELEPETGRTHQLRVHLSETGHPIVGDPTYGKGLRQLSSLPESIAQSIQTYPYQLLHASELSFRHPVEGRRMCFQVPLRHEMQKLEKDLNHWSG
ncbi:MAG: RluA family pseudouridine synthase, partial [bacterium]|nr:RluA family pseudouridine synthase [bacterium]